MGETGDKKAEVLPSITSHCLENGLSLSPSFSYFTSKIVTGSQYRPTRESTNVASRSLVPLCEDKTKIIDMKHSKNTQKKCKILVSKHMEGATVFQLHRFILSVIRDYLLKIMSSTKNGTK